jgi:hypothetical protein
MAADGPREPDLDEDDDEIELDLEDGVAAEAAEVEVESIEDGVAKREAATEEAAADDEDDEPVPAVAREERSEPLAVKVVPVQANEFICKRCFLVKNRSQLKDKKKGLCRDCA